MADDAQEVEHVRTTLGIGTRFVTVPVFAAATGLCERTVNNLFDRGVLQRRRLAATVYVDMEEAKAALAAGKYSPRQAPPEPERRGPGRPVGSTKAKIAAQRAAAVRNGPVG